MNNRGLSRLFSVWFTLFILSFSLFQTNGISQTQKDVEKAANKQDIQKLIKLYDKASTNLYLTIKSQITRAISKMSDPRFFDDMITLLKNEHYQIRSAAATALGKMNDPRAVDPLILALNDENKSVQNSAIYALAETKDPRAIKTLTRGITYDNSRTWPFPSEFSAIKKMGPVLEAPLIEALNDEDPLVRGGAAFALGNLKFNANIEPLVAVLRDENINVRRLALLGLKTRMNDSLVVEIFISVALMDSSAETKEIAMNRLLDILPNIKSPSGSDVPSRLQALLLPRAMDIYVAALNSDNVKIQAKAAANLLKIETPEAIEFHTKASISLLNSDDEDMRIKAAKTLMKLKEPIPAQARTKAEKIIAEESYIKLTIIYDQFQRKNVASLSNTDGEMIAKQVFEYHDFNNMLIRRTITTDLASQDTLRITDYNAYGRPENYKYLCLSKDGNIIKNDSEPALVELFQ
ncbi:MAG: HEAT repeat domain-containing protein, partial [bacterium]|nr:HEAT repeat domain-containing protein [bacterium]